MLAGLMTIQTLRCPHCSAPLQRDANQNPPTQCSYCHSALTQAPLTAAPGTARPVTPGNLVAAAAVLVLVGGGCLVSMVLGKKEPPPAPPAPVVVAAPPPKPPAPPPPAPPSPSREVLRFGEAGTNPGQLSHANHLAVASDGSFFVGETSTGRVQKFAPDGKYVDGITLPPDKLTKKNGVFGMAADAKGQVFVNRVGDVLVYDAATLKLVRTLEGSYPDRYFHGGLAVDASGNVLALADRTGDISLFTLSPVGKVLAHHPVHAVDVTVDGTGRVFLLGGSSLEVRDAKGQVLSKVGAQGRAVAFDGKGHVFVSDYSSVEVLSPDGVKLAKLPVRGDDIGLDAKGRLVAVDGDHVTVSEVSLP